MTNQFKKCLALAALLISSPLAIAATNYTWNVSTGNWSLDSNWLPIHVPNDSVNDDATINTGTVFVDGNFNIHNLTLTGGTLDGAGSLSVSNQFAWSGGVLQGAGTIALASTATMNVTGNSVDRFLYRNINNAGTINWSSTAHFFTGMGATLTNSGTLDFSADSQISYFGPTASPMMTINNSGLLKKSAGAGSTSLQEIVNNTGTITAHSGTLLLDAGGASESGSIFNIDNAATLSFGNGAYLMKSGTILNETAGGHFIVTGALSADATLLTGKNLQMNGSELAINGNLDTDQFAWNSGVLVGSGTTKLQSDITFSTVAWGVQGGRTLDTNGKNFTYGGTALYGNFSGATFNLAGAGTIQNSAGSTFTVSVTSPIADLGIFNDPSKLVFNNVGTFTTSTDQVRVWAEMNNSGQVTIGNGTVSLLGGGTSSGTFSINNSTLKFVGSSTHTLSSTSKITGNGDIVFDAPISDVSGTITSTGAVTSGPTSTTVTNLNSPAQVQTPTFTVANGTMNLKNGATLNTPDFVLQNGTANIDGTLTVPSAGEIDLTGGKMIVNSDSSVTSPTTTNNATLRITSGATMLAGAYTQLGALRLDGGTLSTTGAAQIQGEVTGKGKIDADVSTVGGGQLLPGDQTLAEDIQKISITGALTMDDNSAALFELDADSKQSALLDVGSDVHLASAQLFVELLGNPNSLSSSDVFTIVTSQAAIDGTFNTLNADPNLVDATDADGNVVATFAVHYNPGSVTLTPVPEPSLGFAVVLAGLFFARKKI